MAGFGFSFDPLSFVGGLMNMDNQNKQADKQADLQKEFAQNSIQWRVNDAKKAGIHPLSALGSQGINYNPSYVGGSENFGGSQASISTNTEDKEFAELNKRLLAAQVKTAEAEAVSAQKQASSSPALFVASNANLASQSGVGHSTNTTGVPGQATSAPVYGVDGIVNSSKIAKNSDGSVSLWPGKDVEDMASESLFDRFRWQVSQYADNPKLLKGIADTLLGKGKDVPKGYVIRANPYTLNYDLIKETDIPRKWFGKFGVRMSPANYYKSRSDFINRVLIK